MPATPLPNVIIIGAGLSGLAAAKELIARGIKVTILEETANIASPWRNRHPQLRLNIHRKYAQLPGQRPLPAQDIYLHRDSVVEHLSTYARDLRADIRFQTRVHSIQPADHGWKVMANDADYLCTDLIIATGRERIAAMPLWPGTDTFRGKIIHSGRFGDAREYDGKRVLVIGAGNSGTDILNHLARHNPKQVWVSVRHGPAILPSRIFGFPLHRLAGLFARFPKWSLDPAFTAMQRLFFGNLRRFGLRSHSKGGGTRLLDDGVTFALDDGFVAALKSGRFSAVSETVGFNRDTVELANGDKICPDIVICATGYKPGLDDLCGPLGALDSKGYPRHPIGQADRDNPGLWFTGYGVTFQGFFHAAGISARRIARQIASRQGQHFERGANHKTEKPQTIPLNAMATGQHLTNAQPDHRPG